MARWWVEKESKTAGCENAESCRDSLSKTIRRDSLEGGRTPWSVGEMLDEQHQIMDIPAHARTAHNALLQKRPEEDLC